ncbi:hypothetical protein BCUE_0735 [Candidatus Kinetoplastibacterium blastocrithidii TCC012E]|uniref:Uncharacterized protein n=1 Tax=Candidatus Kinetoplastidibacterium blastocrithidiae TCC012E TaxID=1208922 RepID=M1M459_9PROT|nr:hypothetical protein BCUE_0735 [Candidatus Kinetoplastibacterium blastocrithidii TCC012E]
MILLFIDMLELRMMSLRITYNFIFPSISSFLVIYSFCIFILATNII